MVWSEQPIPIRSFLAELEWYELILAARDCRHTSPIGIIAFSPLSYSILTPSSLVGDSFSLKHLVGMSWCESDGNACRDWSNAMLRRDWRSSFAVWMMGVSWSLIGIGCIAGLDGLAGSLAIFIKFRSVGLSDARQA